MRLAQKVVVVTGASRGLGRALALASAREGAAVVLAARSRDDLEETAWLIDETGGTKLAIPTDVGDPSETQQLAQHTIDHFGRVDIVVTSAGIGAYVPFAELDVATWDRVVDTLLKGTYLSIKAFLPYMMRQKQGHIVAMTAPLERIITPGFTAYTAAKFGVEGLMRTLAKELRPHGIAVNGLHPGGFADTSLIHATLPKLPTGLLDPAVVVEPFIDLVTKPITQTGQIIDAQAWHRQHA